MVERLIHWPTPDHSINFVTYPSSFSLSRSPQQPDVDPSPAAAERAATQVAMPKVAGSTPADPPPGLVIGVSALTAEGDEEKGEGESGQQGPICTGIRIRIGPFCRDTLVFG